MKFVSSWCISLSFLFVLGLFFISSYSFFNDQENHPEKDDTEGDKVSSRRTQTPRSVLRETNIKLELKDYWQKIDYEFGLFKEEFPSSPLNQKLLPGNRLALANSPEFQFWSLQLRSADPMRVKSAERIFTMATAFQDLSSKSGIGLREITIANKINSTFTFTRTLVESERETLKVQVEAGLEPESIKPSDLTKTIGRVGVDGSTTIVAKGPGNSDATIMEDARVFLEYFVPKLQSNQVVESESAKRALNFYTYGLYGEEGTEFWEEALDNIDNLEGFFEGSNE